MENNIGKIEEKIQSSNIADDRKEELLGRLNQLKEESSKEDKDQGVIKKLADEISDSVREFEVSHPTLVEDINYIASSLANMGI